MSAHSVFLPGEYMDLKEPGGLYSPWVARKSDTTELLSIAHAGTKVVFGKFTKLIQAYKSRKTQKRQMIRSL